VPANSDPEQRADFLRPAASTKERPRRVSWGERTTAHLASSPWPLFPLLVRVGIPSCSAAPLDQPLPKTLKLNPFQVSADTGPDPGNGETPFPPRALVLPQNPAPRPRVTNLTWPFLGSGNRRMPRDRTRGTVKVGEPMSTDIETKSRLVQRPRATKTNSRQAAPCTLSR
jgi:hypothetical protein